MRGGKEVRAIGGRGLEFGREEIRVAVVIVRRWTLHLGG
jgi:hypothetical protein